MSRRTLTRGSPRRPNVCGSVNCATSAVTRSCDTPPRLSDTRNLEGGRLWADVRVEPASRRRHQIGWNGNAVLLFQGSDVRCHPVSQRLVGWTEVRAAEGCAVVPLTGGRRPGMEIPVAGERLADQRRADNRAVPDDQAAIGLGRHRKLRNSGDGQGIKNARYHGQNQDQDERGSNLFQHGFVPRRGRGRRRRDR